MSSDNAISDVAEGATKGLLDWSIEKITQFVQKFEDKKLAFIEEKKTIEVVKEQYQSGEAKFYQKYITEKNVLFLVRIGLTLRRIEDDEERLQNLRNKIHNKYGINGLHIAQLVQNGILNRYFGLLIEQLASEEELKHKISEILTNTEKHSLFVTSSNGVAEIIRITCTRIDAHTPPIFVVAGIRSAAKTVAESIIPLEKIMVGYKMERFSKENREILFFKREMK